MGLMDFRPLVRVALDGVPLSGFLFSQLSSVRVSDVAGFTSDSVEIVFSNMAVLSKFQMPSPGAEIAVALGYLGAFKDMGLYVADEVEEASPPRTISIVGRAKAQGETKSGYAPIQTQKTRSWAAGLTLGAIVETMAGENGLKPGITPSAASIVHACL